VARKRQEKTATEVETEAEVRVSGQALFEDARGVFMISVAAELAGMHPQTLRVYEARGLIKPSRSKKQTRLYSRQDVERLKRIQELTSEFGLNLAGVERVLSLEETMNSMRAQLEMLRERAVELEHEMLEQIEAVHRSYRRELVRWEPPGEVLRAGDRPGFSIPIEKKRPSGFKERDGFEEGSAGSPEPASGER
jgi:MerR family transcriptional regulator/heat shock protein HspR